VALADADNPLAGRMNRLNLAAAVLGVIGTLADEVRVLRALPAALEGFRPAPQRLETVADAAGIRWVNDSASTTPESTAASLEAVGGSCLLIAGGHDKGLDPAALIEASRGCVRQALTIGEQAGSLARQLIAEGIAAESVGTVAAAVGRAGRLARSGEVVLFSPGYSSHDQFTHFEERGAAFVREVHREVRRVADSAVSDLQNGSPETRAGDTAGL
jgi:UDP-N-acetylmuramoylalanine--D-glutamate ligase